MENICCEISSLLSNLERIAGRATSYLATNGNEFLQNNQSGIIPFNAGASVGVGAAVIILIIVLLLLQRPKKRSNPSALPTECSYVCTD